MTALRSDIVYNLFEHDYRLIATFDNHKGVKWFLQNDEKAGHVAWIGVFKLNQTSKTVPMWRPWDFINDFPHSS